MNQKFNTVELTKMALLTALICVSAYIVIPLPFTPASLTAQDVYKRQIHSHSEPVSCESIPQKAARGYVLLETTSYDACRRPCQSLEICLVDIKVLRDSWGAKASTCLLYTSKGIALIGCKCNKANHQCQDRSPIH